MVSRQASGLAAALGVVLLANSASIAQVAGGRALEFPHAGIAVTLPEGFELRVLEEPFDVFRAVQSEGQTNVQGVTLSAYLVAAGTSAEAYSDRLTEEMQRNLAVRHLKVLKKVPDFTVAGAPGGAACVLQYTFRGESTAAARVCFVRKLPDPAQDLCYALFVEAPESRKGQVLPVLGEVLKTLKLIPVRHPWQAEPGALGSPYLAAKGKFSIRPPEGWFVEEAPGGVTLGQMDYLEGSADLVQITAQPMAEYKTSEAQAQECLRLARDRFPTAELLREEPVTISGREGRQFVLRYRPPAGPATATQSSEEASEPPLIVVQNALCLPGEGGSPGVHYSMVLTSAGGDPEQLRALLAHILQGLEIAEPTTRPATAPTQGATSGPGEGAAAAQ